jgi:hypothetical protein
MGGMLHGSALEALRFSGSVRYRDNTDRLSVAGLFRGLMEPTVNLATIKLATLDGVGVKGLVSFLLAATSLRHLAILNLVQMHDIRSIMPACRQNGCLHSISISHTTFDNDSESSAERASSHAWFVHITMAFCKRNVELPLLLSGHVSLDSNASSESSSRIVLPILTMFDNISADQRNEDAVRFD